MSDNKDAPAFPVEDVSIWQECGLTKREYFAAKAMQGLLAAHPRSYPCRFEMADRSLRYADALIAELDKRGGIR